MITIASIALSGGQGKTTLTYFLAKKLATKGYKTLVVDLDPQHNISTFLRTSIKTNEASVFEFLKGEVLAPAIYPVHNFENLFVIPADDGLEVANDFLAASGFGIIQLRNRLKKLIEQNINFDYCLIDTPPQKSQLCKTGIGASDYYVIPTEPEVKGVLSLNRTLEAVSEINNTGIIQTQFLGVLPFRDKWYGLNRSVESKQAIQQMSNLVDPKMILPPFRDSTKPKKAISRNLTLEELSENNLAFPFDNLVERLEKVHERPLSAVG